MHTEPYPQRSAGSDKETQLQAILDYSPNLVFVKDPDGRYLFVNRQFENVFHLSRDRIANKTDAELFPPLQAAAFRANDRKVLDAGVPLAFEEVAIHDDGPHTSIVFKFPLWDGSGRPYALGGITTDITERTRMEHALRESQARLTLALEERKRLDADLHDNIIQMAYAVGMSIEQSRHLRHLDGDRSDEALRTAQTHLNQIITDVRSYISRQNPLRLRGDRLIVTLADFVESMQDIHEVQFALHMDPSDTQVITDEQSIHLYSIAREAISNCFRHARARRGILSLKVSDHSIRLEVEDDGAGFDSRHMAGWGCGLRNIRMRVEQLGGRLQLDSIPDHGTKITVDIPRQSRSQ